MRYPTLTDALFELAELDRSITFIGRSGEQKVISFSELKSRALGVLNHLQASGLGPGDELVIVLNNNNAFLDVYWACLLGGIVPVPVAPGVSDEQRLRVFGVFETLKRPHLFTEFSLLLRSEGTAGKNSLDSQYQQMRKHTLLMDDISSFDTPGQAVGRRAHDIAFIQFSSGSTCSPKGVVLTHQNLLSNIRDVKDAARLTSKDVGLSWMPLTHDMGLIGFHLMLLLTGANHVIMATEAFVRRPLRWIQAASEHQATLMCSPNFGYRYLLKSFDKEKAKNLDLSCVRLIFNGAEPISSKLCRTFLDTLAPLGLRESAMFTVYGLAEASLAVSFPEAEVAYTELKVDRRALGMGEAVRILDDDSGMTLVSLGKAIGMSSLRICDTQDAELEEGVVGRILIKGPNVTQGYYLDGVDLNKDGLTSDGWLDTGDLGFTHRGNLYVTGRLKDIIFVNGQNLYCHDIESIISEAGLAELGKVAVAARYQPETEDEAVTVFVQHRGNPQALQSIADQIAKTINQSSGVEVKCVVGVDHLPKTTSGKLQRFALLQGLEQGSYSNTVVVQHTATGESGLSRSATETFLVRICQDLLGLDVGVNDNLFDIGVTSLKMIEIHEKIEQQHPGKIEVADLFDHPNINSLAKYLDAS